MYYLFLCYIAVPLSEDHKPNRTDERKRIQDAGGVVKWDGKPFNP
jgi:protein phosphatase 1L